MKIIKRKNYIKILLKIIKGNWKNNIGMCWISLKMRPKSYSFCFFFYLKQHSMYNLLVRGSDRDGAIDGLSSECDCRIKVLDVNDNFPTLEKTSVSCYPITLFF